LQSSIHLVHGYRAITDKGLVQAVVEIPAGTSAKWEVDKKTGNLIWEFKNGSPRVVNYLPYPANYGMVPRTCLAEKNGGDGDPIDILILGPAVKRGVIVKVQLIGVLKLIDQGEIDDKLIAVMPGAVFGKADSIKELYKKYPGVSDIIKSWFVHYKGAGKIVVKGFGEKKVAMDLLQKAIEEYEN